MHAQRRIRCRKGMVVSYRYIAYAQPRRVGKFVLGNTIPELGAKATDMVRRVTRFRVWDTKTKTWPSFFFAAPRSWGPERIVWFRKGTIR